MKGDDFIPEAFVPTEELMFDTAECRECVIKYHGPLTGLEWARQHVVDTGHAVTVHMGYDVRDEHWLERLPYERLAEIEALRGSKKPLV